jgi:hypothetical protein
MEQRALNQAKIGELKAKTVQIVESIGAEKAAMQLEAFNSAISAIQAHNQMIENRMKALKEVRDSERDTESGGVRQLEGPSGNAGVSGDVE